MAKLIYILSIISFLFGCSPQAPKQSVRYALADSIHFDHAIIDGLWKLRHGEFSRRAANFDDQDIKKEDLPAALQSDALEFEYAGKDARVVVTQLKNQYREMGYLIFLSENNYGRAPDKIAVIKSEDQYDILRFMATNGINHDINTDSIIAKLREWNDKYRLDIVAAELDYVDAQFTGAKPDFVSFAKEVYAFCPDVVDQGTNTVAALADEMERTNSLYLWWD